jgi:Lon protease-like protein
MTLGPHAMQKYPGVEAALDAIPIFPLAQVVLFPGGLLPLHVFEPRYRTMLADALRSHGAIAMVRLREGAPAEEEGLPAIERIAGGGVVLEHQPLGNGRSNVILLGQSRLELEELPFEGPYRRARARVLVDEGAAPGEEDALALHQAIARIVKAVRRRDAGFHFEAPEGLAAAAVADLAAHHLIVSPRTRQALLANRAPRERVRVVTAELLGQVASLEHATAGGTVH